MTHKKNPRAGAAGSRTRSRALGARAQGKHQKLFLLSCSVDGSAGHGQKLRWARKIAATTPWSLTWKFWVGSATAALTIALPPNPVLRWLNMTSTPRSKFLTGFQIVRDPICQKAKSGEQLVGVKPWPLPRLAKPAPVQIRLVAAAS